MGSVTKTIKKIDPLTGAILKQDAKNMGMITGATAAKKAAAAQAAALEEQTRQAQQQAGEAARQAAVQATQVQQREAATREVEAMQTADADSAKAPEVSTGVADSGTTRKRARFQSPGSTIQSVSI